MLTGRIEEIDKKLLQMLEKLSEMLGEDIHVTSGKRTPAENKAVKGSPNSAHLRGKAADCRAHSTFQAARIVSAAWLIGFRRIGIYNTHVHLDIDKSLPTPAAWDFSTNRRQLHFFTSYLVNQNDRA